MSSPWIMIAFMTYLMLAASTAYVSVRLIGARAVDSDHPNARTRHR